jgi:hypothetical protein
VLPLGDTRDYLGNDHSKVLIFGGLNNKADPCKHTVLVTLDNKNLEKAELSDLKTAYA